MATKEAMTFACGNTFLLTDLSVYINAEQIAINNGSQCGFCTPGMVMAIDAQLKRCAHAHQAASVKKLEAGLDGNLCRCTGKSLTLSSRQDCCIHDRLSIKNNALSTTATSEVCRGSAGRSAAC